jgi:hypothetical protein
VSRLDHVPRFQIGGGVDRLQAEYGLEALTNLEHQRRTMRGFKTAQGKLGPENLERWAARLIWKSPKRSCALRWRRKVLRTARVPAALSEELNLTKTLFPGSRLR